MKVINKISNKRKMHVSGNTALMGPSLNCKHPVEVTGSIPACRYKCNLLPPAAGCSPLLLHCLIKDTKVMPAEQKIKWFGRKRHLDFFGKQDQYLPGLHPEDWSGRHDVSGCLGMKGCSLRKSSTSLRKSNFFFFSNMKYFSLYLPEISFRCL